MSRIKKTMNTSTEMTTGKPRPPFRMMAPNGAPIKKKMRHERARVNLLIASILCCLIM
ncbi:Uncharacterised protein [Segatella copri]|nr:Uncharacterised protein [Segatella copri]